MAKRRLNKPLLRRLARRLRRLRHEQHFYQAYWAKRSDCGTAACLAAHAVLLSGYRLSFTAGDVHTSFCRLPGRQVELIEEVAARLLGVQSRSRLFSGDPTGRSMEEPWPEPYRTRWYESMYESKERPSCIAADLLDAIADGKVRP